MQAEKNRHSMILIEVIEDLQYPSSISMILPPGHSEFFGQSVHA